MVSPEPCAQRSVPTDALHEAVAEGVMLRHGHGVVRILDET